MGGRPARSEDAGRQDRPACSARLPRYLCVAVGLNTCHVQDAGKTFFDGVPTFTMFAVGPCYSMLQTLAVDAVFLDQTASLPSCTSVGRKTSARMPFLSYCALKDWMDFSDTLRLRRIFWMSWP